jgi:hypothetical protein
MPSQTSTTQRRPRSLREVVLWAQEGEMDAYLREFLDEFYTARDMQIQSTMLSDEPALVDDLRANAYLAAVAEHLAKRLSISAPSWTEAPSRFLKRPYFPAGLESLKATLLVESPVAFRRRMIFVGAEPLYRPRKDAVGINHSTPAFT